MKWNRLMSKKTNFICALMVSMSLVFYWPGVSSSAFAAGIEICNGVDDDGDGLKDEGFADLDSDGKANCVDTDDDGDGVLDAMDTDDDGDGSPDMTDTDDDNNGVADAVNMDDDSDGIPDALDPDDNNDGVLDINDTDDDDDGQPDALDADDDNDGIAEVEICNGLNDDHDGATDEGFADLDRDGVKNCADADIDGDGTTNIADTDDDNDGVVDATDADDDNNGVPEVEICNGVDDNQNGRTDEGSPDTDLDGQANCVDNDIDGDSTANTSDDDIDGDGLGNDIDLNDDNFGGNEIELCNGIDDDLDDTTDENCLDSDGDGLSSGVDTDDDNDGTPDIVDADDDNDGVPDSVDPDDNNDGRIDPDLDADNDGIDDVADTDDDNDGYPDTTELAAGMVPNSAGIAPSYVGRAGFTPVDGAGNPVFASIQGLTYAGNQVVALATDFAGVQVLAKINLATGVVEASYLLTGSYSAVTSDGSSFYVLNQTTRRIDVLDATGTWVRELAPPTLVTPVGLGYDGYLMVPDNNGGSPVLRFLDKDSGNELAAPGVASSVDVEMIDGALLSVRPDGGVYLVDTSPCNGWLSSSSGDVGICVITSDKLLFSVTGSGGIATDGVNVFAAGGLVSAPSTTVVAGVMASASTASSTVIARVVPINPVDLIMTAVAPTTSSVNAGKILMVSNTVRNQGSGKSLGFKIAFRLSGNAIYGDADDRLITAVRSVASLLANAENTAVSSLVVPGTVPTGSYYVCAQADVANMVNEVNENNNSRCSIDPVTVVSLPDLVETNLAGTVLENNFVVRDSVKNNGTATATAFVISYYLSTDNLYGSDTPLCNRSVAALAVGLTSMASTSCPIPASTTAGVYYIIALVDSGNSVPESNETNNTKASLALRYLPDLVPSSVGLTWLGGVLTVKDAVKNIGSYGAGAFTIRFSLSQITSNVGVSPVVEVPVSGFACSRTVTSLAAGVSNPVIDMASTSCSVGALAVGSYRVRVTDDANNTAVELNELNNTKLIGMFTVLFIPGIPKNIMKP